MTADCHSSAAANAPSPHSREAPDWGRSALSAHLAGISVWPPEEDGTKSPLSYVGGKTWKAGQRERLSREALEDLYANGRQGVGIICGEVSGSLEGLDFDDLETYIAYKATAQAAGLGELVARVEAGYLERTPKDGRHWCYRCVEIAGNTKLARRPGSDDESHPTATTLIETKGEGGYLIVSPSSGSVHPSRKPYELLAGGFDTIMTITPEERRELLRLARTFDEMLVKDEDAVKAAAAQSSERPGDDFNHRATWAQVLEPAGWSLVYSHGETDHWRRPGKDQGVSGTTNHAGSDLLYVFSTSTTLEAERGYSKFGAYAYLEHGGDFSAAAKELRRRGYGRSVARSLQGEADPTSARTRQESTSTDTFALTDLGNAERLATGFGDVLRFENASGNWHHWTGQRWERDEILCVEAYAAKTARSIYQEAAYAESRADRDALAKHAKVSEARERQRAMVASARHMLAIRTNEWDPNPWAFNCLNGTVDLRTGELHSHSRQDLISMLAPVEFDAEARAKTFEEFLATVQPDEQARAFLQRSLGSALTGAVHEHHFWFLLGAGANGKGTLLNVLLAIMGDYAKQAPPDLLTSGKNRHPTELAFLRGARLVIATETQEGSKLNEARVKQLTGGDPITARFMGGDFFTFMPSHKLWIMGNHKPEISGTDHGIWRRPLLVDFPVIIPDQKQDRELPDKLLAEASGILRWCVEGCLAWQQVGLQPPPSVLTAIQLYRLEMDVVGAFIQDCCLLGSSHSEGATPLHRAYNGWCEANGELAMKQRDFGRRLRERGFTSARGTAGKVRFSGLALRSEASEGSELAFSSNREDQIS